ncbi:MAG: glycoside hydrolase family 1 protein, partial [Actinobacteria bacterium]
FRFLDGIHGETDYIGLQYYSRICPRHVFDGTGNLEDADFGEGMSDLHWPIYSQGLYRVVQDNWQRYGKPIMITENGLADAADTRRARFIHDHLGWLHRSLREGVDVRGYYHWATTDNFEWKHGFWPRFGLVEVDYDTLERTVRPSARSYERICRSGEVVLPADHPSLAQGAVQR